jgi:hypothetical protein
VTARRAPVRAKGTPQPFPAVSTDVRAPLGPRLTRLLDVLEAFCKEQGIDWPLAGAARTLARDHATADAIESSCDISDTDSEYVNATETAAQDAIGDVYISALVEDWMNAEAPDVALQSKRLAWFAERVKAFHAEKRRRAKEERVGKERRALGVAAQGGAT